MSVPAFRFAPSPNGALHLGHAYSALLNERMARQARGRFLIRMEDIDTLRCTADLARRALDDLAWLGLTWEKQVRIQSEHFIDYKTQQGRLAEIGLLYPCFCSRTDIATRSAGRDPEGQPLYSGKCRSLSGAETQSRIAAGESHALRIDMTEAVARTGIAAALAWGDVVLARKDIGTSYHMAVVTDDHLQGISHVVRGSDLEAATANIWCCNGCWGFHRRIIIITNWLVARRVTSSPKAKAPNRCGRFGKKVSARTTFGAC